MKRQSLRREFLGQDEVASSTPALNQEPGLHLGRQVALQLLTHMHDRPTGLMFRYQRDALSSSWPKNSKPDAATQSNPLGGGTL